MKNSRNNLQKGFAVVELAIFAVVIIAVAGIGYWALNRSGASAKDSSPAAATVAPTSGPWQTPVTITSKGVAWMGTFNVDLKNGTTVYRVISNKVMNGQKSFTLDANTMNCPKALTVAQCKVAHKWTVLVTNVKTDTTYTQTKSDVFSQTELPNPRISDILPTAGVKVGDKVTIKSSATQQYQGTYQIRWHLAKDENVDSGSHVLVASVSTTNNSKQDTLTFTMPAIPEFDGITANQEIMINVKDFLSQYSNPSKLILIPTPKPMTLTSADIDGKLSTGTVRFVSTQKFAAGTYKINVKQQENPWQKAVATTEGASSFGMLKTTFVKLPAAAYDKCAVATMCAYQFTVTGPNGVESNPITVNVIK